MKKGALKNFAKFTGENLYESLFFNKVAGKRHSCFPMNFAKFLRTPVFIEHLQWLLRSGLKLFLDLHSLILRLNLQIYFF